LALCSREGQPERLARGRRASWSDLSWSMSARFCAGGEGRTRSRIEKVENDEDKRRVRLPIRVT
jgi:hypothetical protein